MRKKRVAEQKQISEIVIPELTKMQDSIRKRNVSLEDYTDDAEYSRMRGRYVKRSTNLNRSLYD